MREKYYKLVLVSLALVVGFIVIPSGVVSQSVNETVNAKEPTSKEKKINIEEKKKVSSKKCWKRVWITSESYKGKSTLPVCKAFEDVLNTSCEPQEKLQCKWTLPPDEKRFKKLEWQSLDPKEYWGLIEDIKLSTLGKKYREGEWKKNEPEFKKYMEQGRLKLEYAIVDIDHNDKPEHIARLSIQPCEKQVSTMHNLASILYGLMNQETKRIDWRYENLFLHANAREGTDIILYEGKAYMFGYTSQNYVGYKQPWKMIWVYEGFSSSLFKDTEFGSVNICQYKYLKGDNKK